MQLSPKERQRGKGGDLVDRASLGAPTEERLLKPHDVRPAAAAPAAVPGCCCC